MPFRCGRSRKAEQNGTQPPLLDGAHRLGWFFPVFRGLAAVPMGRRGGHAALRQPGRDARRPSCRRRLRYRGLASPATDPHRLGSDRRLGAFLGAGSGDLVVLRAGHGTADAVSLLRGSRLSRRRAPGGRRRAVLPVGTLARHLVPPNHPRRAAGRRLAFHHQLGHRPGDGLPNRLGESGRAADRPCVPSGRHRHRHDRADPGVEGPQRKPATLHPAGGGLVANLLADSAFAYLTTTNTYGSGSTTDTGWAAGYLLIAVAGFRAATTRAGSAVTNDGTTGRIWLVLPYLPIALAAIVAVFEEALPGELDPVVFWSVMVLIVGVVLRQYLMLTDNQSLNRRLEANASDLAKREQHFHALVQNSSDVITLIDRHGAIQYQSASVERILGYRESELVGKAFGDLVHPDDRTQALRKIDEAINIVGPPIATECRLRRVDDSYCPAEVTITNLLELPAVRGLVLNTRDVSERKAPEEKLTHQAFHDSLTSLPNRAAFRIGLDHALHGASEGRIAVLFLDLDDFKAVNDTLGHDTGDRLLVAVGARIASTLRPGDTVARLGGDEFAVLLK